MGMFANAFTWWNGGQCRKDICTTLAHAADQRIAAGSAGPLTGIPLAHKDVFCPP